MDKRGMLLAEETLKMIISVIGIAFLIALVVLIYFNTIEDKRTVQAESLLNGPNGLGAEIELMKQSDEKRIEFSLNNAIGWTLFSFSEIGQPNSCGGQKCVCICDDVVDFFDRQLKNCDEEGSCLVIENLKTFDPIEITSEPFVKIIVLESEQGEILISK